MNVRRGARHRDACTRIQNAQLCHRDSDHVRMVWGTKNVIYIF